MSFKAAYARLADDFPDRLEVQAVDPAAGGRLVGEVSAPTSKSYTHRAFMVASLSAGGQVAHPLLCTDSERTVAVWEGLGARVAYASDTELATVQGFDGRPQPTTDVLDVHESGTLFRLTLPGLALCDRPMTLTGNASYRRRANDVIAAPLRELGVRLETADSQDCAPIVVHGQGEIPTGVAHVPGGKSSQAVSGLLLWLPLAKAGTSEVRIDGVPVSMPYVQMTLELLAWAGIDVEVLSDTHWRVPGGQRYRCPEEPYRVPGDYSSAAFLLAAATLVPSDVRITNLRDDAQGDRKIVDILRRMGAHIEEAQDALVVTGPAELTGIEVDCADTPDLVPVLAAVACHARGRTVLSNLLHLRNKESDRIAGPVAQLGRLGARIEEREDAIVIEGGAPLHGGEVDALNDHRIAMSLVVAGLPVGGVRLSGARSILKSYPSFLHHLRTLGAEITSGS